MGFDLSRRVSFSVLRGAGTGIVFENREDNERIPVRILRGPEAARRWIDIHYEGVDWESPYRATALVGRLSDPARPSPSVSGSGGWEHRPLTYETSEFRMYLPELLVGPNGPVILQHGEEYVAESDRWEPFVSILWESTW
jgi:hypothetical protein